MTPARSGSDLRRRNALHIWENRFGPNMTPMVDVVLVILIFFMAGTTFLGQEWFLKTELLKKGAAVTAKPVDPLALPPVWLTVVLDSDPGSGRTRVSGLGEGSTDLAGFAQRIRDFATGTEKGQIVVVLTPGASVPYKDVVKAHEDCAAAGIERIGIGSSER